MAQQPQFSITLRATLAAHGGWVTGLAVPPTTGDAEADTTKLVSCSRDKTLIQWTITHEEGNYGFARRRMTGHNHFVEDVVISSDGNFALSASADHTLRLFDLATGQTTCTFTGHTSDVMSVAFSGNNRQIVSASRDKTIRLWNTLGDCKYVISPPSDTDRMGEGHTEWVSCVRFAPQPEGEAPRVVSAGHDGNVHVYNLLNCKRVRQLVGHTGYVNACTVSPDGSLCASGGADSLVKLWDVSEGLHLYQLETPDNEVIQAMCFSPTRYWLVTASDKFVRVWDLETKSILSEIVPDVTVTGKGALPYCVSLCFSADGGTLFSGWTDNLIRVHVVSRA